MGDETTVVPFVVVVVAWKDGALVALVAAGAPFGDGVVESLGTVVVWVVAWLDRGLVTLIDIRSSVFLTVAWKDGDLVVALVVPEAPFGDDVVESFGAMVVVWVVA